MTNYKKELIARFADNLKSQGFTVYMAASGTYGFYSDETEKRVVSFHYDFGGVKLGGNYHASRQSGTGWDMGTIGVNADAKELRERLYAIAPAWTANTNPKYCTVADQLERYGQSSGYEKI